MSLHPSQLSHHRTAGPARPRIAHLGILGRKVTCVTGRLLAAPSAAGIGRPAPRRPSAAGISQRGCWLNRSGCARRGGAPARGVFRASVGCQRRRVLSDPPDTMAQRPPDPVYRSQTRRTEHKVADRLVVRGAREHNLKDVSLDLPRDALIVFTGLSGSGKSSLAFDTIFAEGQRRYVESLSAYARQFLGQMDKPDVDFIDGLSPAVSIDQKAASRNPRSTVGTITEIYDYMRLLYARVGRPHCPVCGRPIARQTPQQIVDRVLELEDGA